ncbi:MAG TPA: metallophosphoesterase [Actinomycetes bacterium]|nr:metallophosphoesterase [Actinomycetes bacterium]
MQPRRGARPDAPPAGPAHRARPAQAVLAARRGVVRVARALAPWALPLGVGAVGALLLVTLLGRQDARVGPATVRLSVHPALSGSSRLAVPPFGSVSARTHLGLVQFRATLDDVDVPALRDELDDDAPAGGLRRPSLSAALLPLEQEARRAARQFVVRLCLLGLLGGVAATLLYARRTRARLLRCGLGGALATAALLVPALATYDIGAFRAPRYEGALEYAPALIGDARTGLDRLRTLREEMARISENLNRAYDALGKPVPVLGGATVRVLHVADVHLNPAGFDLAQQLATKFDVQAVVDTGDMGTWGLPPERSVTRRVREFKVPYLFVKGNHDNAAMVKAVAANPNARVLDSSATEVAGIRFYGVADPVFSPGQGYRVPAFDRLKEQRSVVVGAALDGLAERPDVLLVHDPRLATYALGHVATVLDGHLHAFRTSLVNGTRTLTTGTVGGAGPDGLRAKEPVPYTAQVIHFDPGTRRPVAVDRITVGALESSFSVDRELLPEGGTAFTPAPVEVPPELLPAPPADQVTGGPARRQPPLGLRGPSAR